ncbi:MAG: glycosyltransferase family 2 protein [Calditrichaeota bacterium]|nr:MAG: glycosyltransferase family 2 protein [Calditrichota bacterium]
MSKGITVLIPVYNEEKVIQETIAEIDNSLKNSNIEEYEIIAINDGSSDNTWKQLETCPTKCKLLNHKRNRGYGASLKTGLRSAKYSTIVITDADGTYPNEKIPELVNYYFKNSLDMLVGARTGANVSYPFIKKVPKFFIKGLASYISGVKIPDINSGLRVFNKEAAINFYHLYPNGFSFTTTITMGMLCDEYEVEFYAIDYFERVGESKIKPVKDTINFFKLLLRIAIYFNPFKFFTPLILILTFISCGFLYKDIFIYQNLTQSSILFPLATLFLFTIGLIADLIIKRSSHTVTMMRKDE